MTILPSADDLFPDCSSYVIIFLFCYISLHRSLNIYVLRTFNIFLLSLFAVVISTKSGLPFQSWAVLDAIPCAVQPKSTMQNKMKVSNLRGAHRFCGGHEGIMCWWRLLAGYGCHVELLLPLQGLAKHTRCVLRPLSPARAASCLPVALALVAPRHLWILASGDTSANRLFLTGHWRCWSYVHLRGPGLTQMACFYCLTDPWLFPGACFRAWHLALIISCANGLGQSASKTVVIHTVHLLTAEHHRPRFDHYVSFTFSPFSP